MKGQKIIFLLFWTVFTVQHSVSLQRSKQFVLQPYPTMGPRRLSTGWTDRSLPACVLRCMERFPTTCLNVLYNNVTHLCTPGMGFDQSEPLPTVDEGKLYTSPCPLDEGFQIHSYNGTETCLFYHNTKMTYTNAQAVCRARQAHLYIIKSVEKLKIIQDLLNGNDLWVGLNDMATEGEYLWEDDYTEIDPSLKPQVFEPGEPNDTQRRENCIALLGNRRNLLDDRSCTREYFFYCERDI